MRITDLLSKDAIRLRVTANSKNEIIQKMVSLMYDTGKITNKKEFEKIVLKRE